MLIPHYKVATQVRKGVIKLNANEGLDFLGKAFNGYPSPQPESCLQFFSDFYSVDRDQIMMSPGIDGGLDALFKWARFKGLNLLSFSPTYGFYKILAEQLGVQYKEIPFLKGGDLPQLKTPISKTIVILCRPNNPTGESCNKSDIWDILDQLDRDSFLFIDEAYADLEDDESMMGLVGHPQVLLGRTLSKAYSLAGLRVGHMLGNSTLIGTLRPFLPPYPIAHSTIKVLEKLIKENYFLKIRCHFPLIKERRKKLMELIGPFGLCFNSKANFVTLQSDRCLSLYREGVKEGILFRLFEKDKILRLSIPEASDMEKVLAFFKRRTP